MNQLIKNIEQWAEDRNLINGSTPRKQFIKLMEEFGELCSGVSKNKVDVVKDSIGDCFIVMVILSKQLNFDIEKVCGKSYAYHDHTKVDKCSIIARIARDMSFLILHLEPTAQCKCESITNTVRNLNHLSHFYLFDFKDCVQSAWEEIKDRKGKMIDGVFVKESDLQDDKNE